MGSMYFANSSFLEEKITQMLDTIDLLNQKKLKERSSTIEVDANLVGAGGPNTKKKEAKEKEESEDDSDGLNKIKFLILSLSACTSVDSSAIHALEEVAKDLRQRNPPVKLVFAQVGNRAWRTMYKAGLV